uniref:nuclear cap-binding protein subunit 2 n=1 Tax=Monopterus albus TaxID=43700 RepID=UPI0009B39E9C|nr:nuclear cap-binding protein subunit 2-like [Monopterus albus]
MLVPTRSFLKDGHKDRKFRHQRNAQTSIIADRLIAICFTMSVILNALNSDSYIDISQYRDQHFKGNRYDQEKLLKQSHTLYVGNLSFYTTEEQKL